MRTQPSIVALLLTGGDRTFTHELLLRAQAMSSFARAAVKPTTAQGAVLAVQIPVIHQPADRH